MPFTVVKLTPSLGAEEVTAAGKRHQTWPSRTARRFSQNIGAGEVLFG